MKIKCEKCGHVNEFNPWPALAKLGGSATSRRKATAARRNARKGGWPKGRPRKPVTNPAPN